MAMSKNPYGKVVRELATLILSVAGESVGMMKRSAPEETLRLKPKDEWGIYLEFLKILFNLSDRFSALHVPLKEQPQFMDNLEDAVADQLKTAMAPILSTDADPMEIVLTIGNTVAESRQVYEQFHFFPTEDTKEKEACFALLGERVAEAMGARDNAMVTSAATVCAGAVIPAMQSLFGELTGGAATAHEQGGEAAVDQAPATPDSIGTGGNEIKLLSVMSSIQGEEVETRWGLHPQFRQDLSSQESRELSKLMNRVTHILGERYAAMAFSESWAAWHPPGHA